MGLQVYNEAKLRIASRASGTIDLENDTLKIMLLSASYTPDLDHDFVDDVVAAELSCTGYVGGWGSAGRKTLAGNVLSKDNANDRVVLAGTDLTWTAVNGATVRYAVLHKPVTSDALSPLIGYLNVNPTAGITFDGNDWKLVLTNGVLRFL